MNMNLTGGNMRTSDLLRLRMLARGEVLNWDVPVSDAALLKVSLSMQLGPGAEVRVWRVYNRPDLRRVVAVAGTPVVLPLAVSGRAERAVRVAVSFRPEVAVQPERPVHTVTLSRFHVPSVRARVLMQGETLVLHSDLENAREVAEDLRGRVGPDIDVLLWTCPWEEDAVRVTLSAPGPEVHVAGHGAGAGGGA